LTALSQHCSSVFAKSPERTAEADVFPGDLNNDYVPDCPAALSTKLGAGFGAGLYSYLVRLGAAQCAV
jgi:hypothetical protein